MAKLVRCISRGRGFNDIDLTASKTGRTAATATGSDIWSLVPMVTMSPPQCLTVSTLTRRIRKKLRGIIFWYLWLCWSPWTGRPGTPIVWDPAINKVLKILDGGVNDLLSLLLPECELPIICIGAFGV